MNKKNVTSIAFALLVSASALAQNVTIRVQGAPRKVNNEVAARVQKAAEAAATTCVDFAKIERWAGEGDCRAALALKWADAQNEEKTLVWGYRWNSGETKTGEDLIRAVVKADPALYMMATNGAWGLSIGGFGYDVDGDRYVTLTTMEAEIEPRNGVFDVPTDEFETSAATKWGEADAWNCGWMSGFWNYYTAERADEALQMSMTGATGRTLTDGCVDAYVFGYFATDAEPNVYDGNLEYLPATTDFSRGTFVLNEGWFGKENASVNHLATDGTWTYRSTDNIGATGCYATAWGNRYYIMAKQPKDAGAAVEGGRITICDANSMRIVKQIAEIGGGDGRSFCGVDEHKAYVSTSKGIYVLDLDAMEVGDAVLTTAADCGNMVRLGDYVYAIEYGKNVHIIRCADNAVVQTIQAPGCGSIVMAKDGSLFVSTTAGIARLNTAEQTLEEVALGEAIAAPSQSMGGWNPDGFCASQQHNVLYWTASEGWDTKKVYKYDIDADKASLIIDLSNDPDGRAFYASSALRVDPVSDILYTNLVKGWTYNDNVVRTFDTDGNQLAEYATESNYWFPEMFVFPDTENPVFGEQAAITVNVGEEQSSDINVTDADNLDAAIVKTVESVADEAVATATVQNGRLVVKGLKEGSTDVVVKALSNGISATKTLAVNVVAATGVDSATEAAEAHEVARYAIDGKRVDKAYKGVVVVRYSDGTTKKIIK